MIKIGFIDYYLDEWHALNYPKFIKQQFGDEFKDKDRGEYLDHLKNMQDDDYKRFMTSLERQDKMGLINGIVSQEADLMLLFEPSDMVKPMDMLMKEDKIKLMNNLDKEFLVPMIEELPIDLTQIVLSQIDPRIFSEILAEDFQDILSSVVLFSNKAAQILNAFLQNKIEPIIVIMITGSHAANNGWIVPASPRFSEKALIT